MFDVFVGRDAELSLLRQRLEAAASGRPSVVFVSPTGCGSGSVLELGGLLCTLLENAAEQSGTPFPLVLYRQASPLLLARSAREGEDIAERARTTLVEAGTRCGS